MSICTNCHVNQAIAFTTFDCFCEECAIDVALSLLAHSRLSEKSIQALITSGWDIPTKTQPHFTATDIANELNCSAQKVGKIANLHGVKTEQYGEWRLDQAVNSRKQIETFWYNSAGKKRIMELIEVTTK
ncbi:hypothetical protein EQ875_01613 [Photobacterium damselae subsp. damselae]|uniref:hypothetical protein n=1 Tax=Photobacterium damselae TaxID=38293 RepID=UPI00109BA1F4|nr:hypothetical protein [Photobacterium damselae]TGZ35332.1 hypothetical protein EQ875_01613 [Photobacterium damselae subsp. damselae]